MDLNHFKDILFDLMNESNELGVTEIEADDQANTFTLTVADGAKFTVICQRME